MYDPRVRGVDVDDNELLAIHSEILREKPLLNSAFNTFYSDMANLSDAHLNVSGQEIELGSGAGFFKSVREGLVTSDIRKSPNIDIELDAMKMDLEDNSVRAIYAINVFHHLPDPQQFFLELIRVLNTGGGCVLIEPHGGFMSALVHKHLHSDEHFDVAAHDWKTEEIGGPLSGANQAMAFIIFERDIERFKKMHDGRLEIVSTGYEHNHLRYLFSGGLNFRQLLPAFMAKPLALLERLCSPLARHLSLHRYVVLRKI